MSVRIMADVFDSTMESTKKFILLAYADHADHQGKNIFPSVATVAKKTGYSERTVQRVTRQLEEDKILVADGTGKHGTNKWKIDVKAMGDTVSPVTATTDRGDTDDSIGVTTTTLGVTDNVTRTIIEPSVKPSINQHAMEEISKLFNFKNTAPFDTLLTTVQKQKLSPLFKKDVEKCIRIAENYANEGVNFQRAMGKVINNFGTWRESKNKNSIKIDN